MSTVADSCAVCTTVNLCSNLRSSVIIRQWTYVRYCRSAMAQTLFLTGPGCFRRANTLICERRYFNRNTNENKQSLLILFVTVHSESSMNSTIGPPFSYLKTKASDIAIYLLRVNTTEPAFRTGSLWFTSVRVTAFAVHLTGPVKITPVANRKRG